MNTTFLWVFPESDFPAWQAIGDNFRCQSYAEFLALTAGQQAAIEREGKSAVRVTIPVSRMREAIDRGEGFSLLVQEGMAQLISRGEL